MNLISRKEVISQIEFCLANFTDYKSALEDTLKRVKNTRSTFEGMTVGEVMKAILGIEDEQIVEAKYLVSIYPIGNSYDPFITIKKNVWNAKYKAESEG